jgi:DNA-binding NarL/FixJ family response regulator
MTTPPRPSAEPARPVRVAVVSHREILMRGVVSMLSDYPGRVLVASLPTQRASVAGVDVVLYDLMLLDSPGGDPLAHLVAETGGRVLGVGGPHDAVHRQRAEERGVAACLPTDIHADELVAAIERVAAGQPLDRAAGPDWSLSKRELEILALICEGLSNEQIADRLFISGNTLKSHIRRAYHKIGVGSRSQAVLWFTRYGDSTS